MTAFARAGALTAAVLTVSAAMVSNAGPGAVGAAEKVGAADTKATASTEARPDTTRPVATKPALIVPAVPRAAGDGKAGVMHQVKDAPGKAATVAKPQVPLALLKISIDLTAQRMSVKEHGKALHSWPISSGRSGFATVTGNFRPLWLTPMHYSRKYDNAPMPNAIFFKGGFAIHATYATGLLGRPASHGCIRLSPSNARTLYGLVLRHGRQQTAISVHGTAREPAPVVAAKPVKPRLAQSAEAAAWSHYRNPAKPMRTEPPKIIYRNGQAFIYVGREQAQRYWRQRYSGTFSSW